MCALTMEDHVYVLLEDPLAPSRADTLFPSENPDQPAYLHPPSHYRTTFLTLSPPGALEQLLNQLKARWMPVRQAINASQRGTATAAQQLTIEGVIFTIGTDWLVRAGNVILGGGAVRGMLLEAEYLPLPVLQSPMADGTSELLSNLLTSILPNVSDARTVAVTISDAQWEDVLWDREEEERAEAEKAAAEAPKQPAPVTMKQESHPPMNNTSEEEPSAPEDAPMDIDAKQLTEKESPAPTAAKTEVLDSIHVYGDEEVKSRKGDWTGIERDRRSAFLIIGALRSEGIL